MGGGTQVWLLFHKARIWTQACATGIACYAGAQVLISDAGRASGGAWPGRLETVARLLSQIRAL